MSRMNFGKCRIKIDKDMSLGLNLERVPHVGESCQSNKRLSLINASSAIAIRRPNKSSSSMRLALQTTRRLAPSGNMFANSGNRCSDVYFFRFLGMVTEIAVLTARQSLLSGQLSQIEDLFSEIESVISLYHALGGGVR